MNLKLLYKKKKESLKMKNEEIRIGSRVKIKENTSYFDEKCHPLSLKGRVGIVVDDAGNDMMTVLFPGWSKGHDGSVCSRSKRNFGDTMNTCWYIYKECLKLVHDGFEIGDAVEYETADGYTTGTIVDFSIFDGSPLVAFPDADFVTHDGNGYCVTNERHSMRCYYCDPERLSPKVSKPAASVSVSTQSDGTIVVTIPRGQKVEIVSL